MLSKIINVFKTVIDKLSGADRRDALGQLQISLGKGSQTYIAKTFNVGRDTIRKGTEEVMTGARYEDAFKERGRKHTTEKLPNLKKDIKKIAEQQTQIDPKFQTENKYTRLSASEIRRQLISEMKYTDEELPTVRTIATITNELGYRLRNVLKSIPIKRIPETNEIFINVKRVNKMANDDDDIVRFSIDAKDKVKMGNFSRRGKSRVEIAASDHDFGGEYATPFGIMDYKIGDIHISIARSKITADYIVDRIEEVWISSGYAHTKHILILSADNGPENSSHRTQFIKRIAEFSMKYNVTVHLTYYPPYHSKYNPIEHVWGRLEMHWNGSLLDSIKAVIGYSKSMTYNGIHPIVTEIDTIYETGIKLKPKIMKIYEKAITRIGSIGKWYVIVEPEKCRSVLSVLSN